MGIFLFKLEMLLSIPTQFSCGLQKETTFHGQSVCHGEIKKVVFLLQPRIVATEQSEICVRVNSTLKSEK